MLEFEPQTTEELRARYPEATVDVYDVDEMREKPHARPGLQRKHVFDHVSGLRLIISRDYDSFYRTRGLHVSSSLSPNHTETWLASHEELKGCPPEGHLEPDQAKAILSFLCSDVLQLLKEIGGPDIVGQDPLHVTDAAVLHWYVGEQKQKD